MVFVDKYVNTIITSSFLYLTHPAGSFPPLNEVKGKRFIFRETIEKEYPFIKMEIS
jgi:hypothetical protein